MAGQSLRQQQQQQQHNCYFAGIRYICSLVTWLFRGFTGTVSVLTPAGVHSSVGGRDGVVLCASYLRPGVSEKLCLKIRFGRIPEWAAPDQEVGTEGKREEKEWDGVVCWPSSLSEFVEEKSIVSLSLASQHCPCCTAWCRMLQSFPLSANETIHSASGAWADDSTRGLWNGK